MNRNLARTVVSAIIFLASASIHSARAQSLPKGEVILDKNVEGTGGKDAHEKIKNWVVKGTVEIGASGARSDLTVYMVAPDKIYLCLRPGDLGTIEHGCDGKIAWAIDPTTGPRVMEDAERDSWLHRTAMDHDANWRKYFKKAECTGEEIVDGKNCYRVEITETAGRTRTHFYDKSTYRRLKEAFKEKTPGGEFEMESTFSDFRKVGAITMPFTTHQSSSSAPAVDVLIKFDAVECNVDIPADRFNLPAEIKKLLDAPKK